MDTHSDDDDHDDSRPLLGDGARSPPLSMTSGGSGSGSGSGSGAERTRSARLREHPLLTGGGMALLSGRRAGDVEQGRRGRRELGGDNGDLVDDDDDDGDNDNDDGDNDDSAGYASDADDDDDDDDDVQHASHRSINSLAKRRARSSLPALTFDEEEAIRARLLRRKMRLLQLALIHPLCTLFVVVAVLAFVASGVGVVAAQWQSTCDAPLRELMAAFVGVVALWAGCYLALMTRRNRISALSGARIAAWLWAAGGVAMSAWAVAAFVFFIRSHTCEHAAPQLFQLTIADAVAVFSIALVVAFAVGFSLLSTVAGGVPSDVRVRAMRRKRRIVDAEARQRRLDELRANAGKQSLEDEAEYERQEAALVLQRTFKRMLQLKRERREREQLERERAREARGIAKQ